MRYIILSTIIFLFSCTQPSLIEDTQNMKDFGLNMECEIKAKYEDKIFFRIYCRDLDEGSAYHSDYWKEAKKTQGSIRVIFKDKENFTRHTEVISVSSFAGIVRTGDISYEGTIKTELLSKEIFDKVSKLRLGTKSIRFPDINSTPNPQS